MSMNINVTVEDMQSLILKQGQMIASLQLENQALRRTLIAKEIEAQPEAEESPAPKDQEEQEAH